MRSVALASQLNSRERLVLSPGPRRPTDEERGPLDLTLAHIGRHFPEKTAHRSCVSRPNIFDPRDGQVRGIRPGLRCEAKRHQSATQLLVHGDEPFAATRQPQPDRSWRTGLRKGAASADPQRERSRVERRRQRGDQRLDAWLSNFAEEPDRDVEVGWRDPSDLRVRRGTRDVFSHARGNGRHAVLENVWKLDADEEAHSASAWTVSCPACQFSTTVAGGEVRSTNTLTRNRPSGATS